MRLIKIKFDKSDRVMNKIESRQEISILVNTFYTKIRNNETLGPIFNNRIPADKWPEHIDKLTDFWETNLFGIAKFKGSPTRKHIEVDESLHNTIDQSHFAKWLKIWLETIDELYEGDIAFIAKNAARKMATGQYIAIWKSRQNENNNLIHKII